MPDKHEKTEKPTQKKVREARKDGQVPRTPEIGAWVAMLAAGVTLHHLVTWGMGSVRALLIRCLGVAAAPTPEKALTLLHDGAVSALLMAVAVGSGVLLLATLAAAGQGGIHLATKALKPKWSRLNPLQGLKRAFGPHAAWEGVKILLKSAMVALLVWRGVHGLMPLLGGMLPVQVSLQRGAEQATALIRDVAFAGLFTALADYAVQRRRVGNQIKMTKREVKDEHRQSEGDPLMRSALRSRQLSAARNRMMVDVPTADVVLVNPTHVAVALRYEPDRGAPRLVAKGSGAIAARIRERATEHRVPLVEDVPLARALHRSCEVGQEIPAELYQAVAQVLAFVLSRRTRGTAAGTHRSPRQGLADLSTPTRAEKAARRRRTPVAPNPSGTTAARR